MPIPQSFIKNIAIEIDPDYQLDNTPEIIIDYETGKSNKENNSSIILFWYKVKNKFFGGIKDNSKKDGTLSEKDEQNIKKSDSKNSKIFVGRDELKKRFLGFLNNNSKKGIFLVTGYRGMGKTSFVNKVIREYKNESHNIIPIHLTLTQSNPKEIDILKLIVISVYDNYKKFIINCDSYIDKPLLLKNKLRDEGKLAIISALAALLLIAILKSTPESNSLLFGIKDLKFNNINLFNYTFAKSINLIIKIILYLLVAWLFYIVCKLLKLNNKIKSENEIDNALNRIRWLAERCHTSLTEEVGHDGMVNFYNVSTNIFSKNEKRTKSYAIATPKEIEYELQQFLSLAKDAENPAHKLEFIFIFDELDKVDPAISTSYIDDNLGSNGNHQFEDKYQKDLRERKQAIINIISGLKNFFTTANARFIFIAGREMFDANLADISDRQSSLSSIFTYVFNIESLLKEKGTSENKISLSNAIESILSEILLGKEGAKQKLLELVSSHQYYIIKGQNDDTNSAEKNKLHFLLQNFVTYLSYRCNGSPKKLFNALHEYILIQNGEFDDKQKEKTVIVDHVTGVGKQYVRKYLYFKYYDLYKIGFISYLFRPFLIQFGRSFKNFSDNIIVSTSYLFDHLIKFHPFAFSVTNLELIPEVLSTNKTPFLRQHIKEIISYLTNNHVRETEICLFDYKFYSFTSNEFAFISKVFEAESAAFNFTLDESYLVKLHVRSKIKELRNSYSRILNDSESTMQQIFSIAHLNDILGDLHFFDQEFDDAILAYSDAIKPIDHLDPNLNIRDFITLIRGKLKIGLCFEKTSSYEEALSFYTDSCDDAKRFILLRTSQNKTIPDAKMEDQNEEKIIAKSFYTSSLNEVLPIVLQCFLSKITIQEKMGLEGINTPKVSIALGGFLKLCQNIEVDNKSGKSPLVIASAYLAVGKLLYFKNSSKRTQHNSWPNYPQEVIDNFIALENKFKIFDKSTESNVVHTDSLEETDTIRRKPILALFLYILALDSVLKSRLRAGLDLKNINKENSTHIIRDLISSLNKYPGNDDEDFASIHYRYIANCLSNIGDCLLGMLDERAYKDEGFKSYSIAELFVTKSIEEFCLEEARPKIENTKEINEKLNFLTFFNIPSVNKSLIDVLKCYYLSSQYYLRFGRTVSCCFQYRKILQVLKLVLKEAKDKNKDKDAKTKKEAKEFLKLLEEYIIKPALNIVNQNTGFASRHMQLKAETKVDSLSFILNNISNNPDSREIIFLYFYIKIKLGFTDFPIDNLISNNNSFSSQFSRLLELDFHAKYVYEKNFKGKHLSEETVQPAIDYCFSMLSIVKILKIYGTDYNVSLAFYAYTHFRLGQFIKKYENNIFIFEQVKSALEKYLGSGSFTSLDHIFHFQIAKEYYTKVIQLHTAGSEYKKTISDMIYLEDDFNDNGYHFGAAFDRYLMINNLFKKRITECDEYLIEVPSSFPDNYL